MVNINFKPLFMRIILITLFSFGVARVVSSNDWTVLVAIGLYLTSSLYTKKKEFKKIKTKLAELKDNDEKMLDYIHNHFEL